MFGLYISICYIPCIENLVTNSISLRYHVFHLKQWQVMPGIQPNEVGSARQNPPAGAIGEGNALQTVLLEFQFLIDETDILVVPNKIFDKKISLNV